MRGRQAAAAAAGAGAALALVVAARRVRAATLAHLATPTTETPLHRGGSGSPVLLLHGVGANWRAWKPILPYLEPHHDVLAPTLLGHGGAAALAADVLPSIDALTDGVEAELDRAGLDTVHVVGNSLGGWIALELARRGRARSVVVFSPGGAWTDKWRIDIVATALRLGIATLAALAGNADTLAGSPFLRRLLLSAQVEYPDRVDPTALAADIRASAFASVVGPLLRVLPQRQIEAVPPGPYPVRVVWAERDRVIPFAHFGAPLLRLVPGAELVLLPGVGHVPMSDDPAAVAQQILEVTAAVDRGASLPGPEAVSQK